jgi:hypothetical protein
MNSSPLRLLLPAALAVVVAFGAGYSLGQDAGVIRLPHGEIPVDPTDDVVASAGIDNDGILAIRIDEAGKLSAEGLTYRERTGTLELAIVNDYAGPLQLAIERNRGGLDPWFVVYTTSFDRGVTGSTEITVDQAGSYRISAIPGNPPLVASTAVLEIVEAVAP